MLVFLKTDKFDFTPRLAEEEKYEKGDEIDEGETNHVEPGGLRRNLTYERKSHLYNKPIYIFSIFALYSRATT